MSSGSNLTKRQRRGKTVIIEQDLPPLSFFIQNYNVPADTVILEFPTDIVVNTDPAAWDDVGIDNGSFPLVDAVMQPSARQVRLHFTAAFTNTDVMQGNLAKRPVLSVNSAPLGPFKIVINSMNAWPPGLP